MNQILWPWLDKGIAIYLDNIIIYSKSLEEHVRLLEQILAWLAEHQLFVKWSKCNLGLPTTEFFCHIISSKGVPPDPSKIESIRQWPVPTSVHDIQIFLGIVGYYSLFVYKHTNKAAALTDLLKKSNKQQQTIAAQKLFEQLKLMHSTAPILQYPWFDLPFVYSTDASGIAVRATLLQDQD